MLYMELIARVQYFYLMSLTKSKAKYFIKFENIFYTIFHTTAIL